MTETPRHLDGLSEGDRDRIHVLVEQFKSDWNTDRRQEIDAYLPPEGPVRRDLLVELVYIELNLRLAAGESARIDEYRRRFPDITALLADPFPETQSLHQEPVDSTVLADAATLPPKADAARSAKSIFGDLATSFGDYELLEELGRGGMGVVYKARHRSLDRFVALKMIRSGQLAGEDEVRRFRQEAEAAARLDHSHIVPVFEVGEHEGHQYFSMVYVEGETLAQRIAAGPLPPREAARLVQKLTSAVQHAHDHGIIHRDLKPANILLDRQGQPRVTDFGLARKIDTDSSLTGTGQILGTPSFMSPEQAGGQTEVIRESSDIYALGAILYCLLTGRPPFQASTPTETILQVIGKEPVSPRELNPAVDRDLETICLKCLEKRPQERYSSAAALGEELRLWLQHKPIVARPVSRVEKAWRWCRRNRLVAGLALAIALLFPFATIISTWFAIQAGIQAERADMNAAEAEERRVEAEQNAAEGEKRRKEADEARIRAEAALEASERSKYVTLIASAQREWETGTALAAWRYLNICRKDLRGWEHKYLSAMFRRNQRSIDAPRAGTVSVAISPDGRQIVGAGRYSIKAWNMSTGTEIRTTWTPSIDNDCAAFSPDGRWIVSGGSDKLVKVWDSANGQQKLTLTGHSDQVKAVAFSPDGKQIASGGMDRQVKVWDATSGNEIASYSGHPGHVVSVAFSPDGKRIVSGSYSQDRNLKVWDVASGKEPLTLKGHPNPVFSVSFSPDGERIVSGSLDKTIKIWDTASGEEIRTLTGHSNDVLSIALSPNGHQIASASRDHMIKLWDASSGQELRSLKGHTGEVYSVAFSPDGNSIVSVASDALVKVWRVSPNDETLSIGDHAGGVFSAAISPDGMRIASGCWDFSRDIAIWDTLKGQKVQTLTGKIGAVPSVAFSRDEKWIASGSDQGIVTIWDASSGRRVLTLKGGDKAVRSVAVSRDGSRIASGSEDNTIKVWDVSTGRTLHTLKEHTGQVRSVVFSPDGATLASGSWDTTIKVWDVQSGRARATFKNVESVESVAFSPDGRQVAGGDTHGVIRLWDASSGRLMYTLQGHSGAVHSVSYSPDGMRIVSGSADRTVRLWDAANGLETLILRGHSLGVFSVTFSPEGNQIISGSDDRTIKVWDAKSDHDENSVPGVHRGEIFSVAFSTDGTRVFSAALDHAINIWQPEFVSAWKNTLQGHADGVHSIAVSSDGARLASGSRDQTVKIWDTSSGKEVLTFKGHAGRVYGVAFSPDGKRIASASWDKTIKIWDMTSGREALTFRGHAGRAEAVAFSPDGRRIASAGWDPPIKLWDASSGEELLTLNGHADNVNSLDFSSDGKWIVSGSDDRTIRIWDATNGELKQVFKGHADGVNSVAFSPDDNRIVSGGSDHSIRLWDAANGQELRAFRRHTGRVFCVAFSPDGQQIASGGEDGVLRVWNASSSTTASSSESNHSQEEMSTAMRLAHSLFSTELLNQMVIEKLKARTDISESVRQLAIEYAGRRPLNPRVLNEQSWIIVRSPNQPAEQYSKAFRWAEIASRTEPEAGHVLNTYGVALYRTGKFAEAVKTLTRSIAMNSKSSGFAAPADTAFLAMAKFHTGQIEAARTELEHTRKLMANDRWKNDRESVEFLREAEELISPASRQPVEAVRPLPR